ncbi:MAG: ATP-grasp protein [Clostridia bacterium]|jgi:5-(carboxyamino)imidazole ribonucleotide synthase|nr:ATP-grasp protein [Clostridia bacterium]
MKVNEITQIGIVGGGSAALMLVLEAAKKGIRTTLLDPEINCIGAEAATEHMIATITNESIQKLSLRSDVIIVNTQLDYQLESKLHAPLYPSQEVMNKLSDKREIFTLLEGLQIPMTKTYYQDNEAETFNKIEELKFPFRFMKHYSDRVESMNIFTKEDAEDFILEEEKADSYIIQPITEYTSVIACLCIVDKGGKAVLYDPLEEEYEDDTLCKLSIASHLSKTMVQKITRYNKKLLKELGGCGVFTIKYGLTSNKKIEFLEMTPEISLSGILTLEAYDMPIYEQYVHMVLGMKVVSPTLMNHVHGTVKQNHAIKSISTPYHLYNIGVTRLCVTLND